MKRRGVEDLALDFEKQRLPWFTTKWTFRRDDFEAILGVVVQVRLKLERYVEATLARQHGAGGTARGVTPIVALGVLRRVSEQCYWLYVRLQATVFHLQWWRTCSLTY